MQLETGDSPGSITPSTVILLSCTKFTCMYLSDSPVFTYRYDFRLCRQGEALQLWCRATGTGGDREHYPENNMPSTCCPVLICKVHLYTVPAILTCVYLYNFRLCRQGEHHMPSCPHVQSSPVYSTCHPHLCLPIYNFRLCRQGEHRMPSCPHVQSSLVYSTCHPHLCLPIQFQVVQTR